MNKHIITFMLSLSLCSVVEAAPTTLVCDYHKYASPDGVNKVSEKFQLNFIVDSNADKAYVLGNNGTEEVTMLPSGEGFTFIEVTAVGNVMTTTVDTKGGSVHSRNTVLHGELIPSQYYGICEFK